MKKIIMTLVCMLLSISVSSSAFATTIEADRLYDQANQLSKQIYQIEQAMLLQQDALSACALFDKNLPIAKNGQIIYPDSYAGRYIDDDGHLIIQVASSDFTPYEYLQDIYSIVEFKEVEYSTKHLEELIEEYMQTGERFLSIYADTKLNKVVVEVDAETLTHKSNVRSNLPIIYKKGSASKAVSKTISSGDLLTNKRSNSLFDINNHIKFSAGFGATYNSSNALIACGHGMNVGDKIYSGLTHIGTVEYVSFSNYCEGDFSIIRMEGNNTVDNKISVGNKEYEYSGTTLPVVGMQIVKETENSGYCAFKISEVDVCQAIYINDTDYVIIKGQTNADRILGVVQPGDSGGVFWKDDKGRYFSVGIISGWNDHESFVAITPTWRITFFGNCSINV